jgi:serine phosphatase RsbU (regulator of sigma subunit)
MLTIALSARGTTYGALTIAQRAGIGFDTDAVAFLEDFAHRVAVTLDTARALAESRRVAAVLSRDLTPPRLPDLDGVEFATYYRVAFEQDALGGDFYDVHGNDDGWTAVMGDVCGKGVEAAVLTGKVRQAVRTGALVDRDPAQVLRLVNRVLIADSDETFVTAVCARGRKVGDDRLRQVLEDIGACHASAQVESVAMALSAHLRDRDHDDIAILAVQSSSR